MVLTYHHHQHAQKNNDSYTATTPQNLKTSLPLKNNPQEKGNLTDQFEIETGDQSLF